MLITHPCHELPSTLRPPSPETISVEGGVVAFDLAGAAHVRPPVTVRGEDAKSSREGEMAARCFPSLLDEGGISQPSLGARRGTRLPCDLTVFRRRAVEDGPSRNGAWPLLVFPFFLSNSCVCPCFGFNLLILLHLRILYPEVSQSPTQTKQASPSVSRESISLSQI
ncbi:hypothetical protein LY76DRAFT_163803 [Colletotrichum caudatum]|nr:hypothetical protein LY76DRAFT_163803 [Colletotrichum caudatum]